MPVWNVCEKLNPISQTPPPPSSGVTLLLSDTRRSISEPFSKVGPACDIQGCVRRCKAPPLVVVLYPSVLLYLKLLNLTNPSGYYINPTLPAPPPPDVLELSLAFVML
jgi:hypothetical protein